MDETTMPAVEATENHDERDQYELAFHLLPTVADGEVSGVIAALKAIITTHNGEILEEENPQRFTLAYEIRKAVEGRSLRFTNSWYGWIRFSLMRSDLESVTTEIVHRGEVLRHLLVRLTREEAAHPHRVFVGKQESATVVDSEDASGEVADISDDDLNKSLEGITS